VVPVKVLPEVVVMLMDEYVFVLESKTKLPLAVPPSPKVTPDKFHVTGAPTTLNAETVKKSALQRQ
jgi:hypothetical protein